MCYSISIIIDLKDNISNTERLIKDIGENCIPRYIEIMN